MQIAIETLLIFGALPAIIGAAIALDYRLVTTK